MSINKGFKGPRGQGFEGSSQPPSNPCIPLEPLKPCMLGSEEAWRLGCCFPLVAHSHPRTLVSPLDPLVAYVILCD